MMMYYRALELSIAIMRAMGRMAIMWFVQNVNIEQAKLPRDREAGSCEGNSQERSDSSVGKHTLLSV